MIETARLAEEGDHQRLMDLWLEAETEMLPQRGGALLLRSLTAGRPSDTAVRAAITDATEVLVVGLIDDAIVGFGHASAATTGRPPTAALRGATTLSSPSAEADPPGRLGTVGVLYVEPPARGVGVGEAVLSVLLLELGRSGCDHFDAVALPGNRAAKAFFETHGFVARLLVMHRSPPVASSAV